jgi:hypothetical protein
LHTALKVSKETLRLLRRLESLDLSLAFCGPADVSSRPGCSFASSDGGQQLE